MGLSMFIVVDMKRFQIAGEIWLVRIVTFGNVIT